MEAITIGLLCATVFGVMLSLVAFIRQLSFSRDTTLNEMAQKRALSQETLALEEFRTEILPPKRFASSYLLLGENGNSIQRIDEQIEEVLLRGISLIERYANVVGQESSRIIMGESSEERKRTCDKLKKEIDKELVANQVDLHQLQTKRAELWNIHRAMQNKIIEQECAHNQRLNTLCEYHSKILEKIYLRHTESVDAILKQSKDSSEKTFSEFFTSPIQVIIALFKSSLGISPDKAIQERASREQMRKLERSLNSRTALPAESPRPRAEVTL